MSSSLSPRFKTGLRPPGKKRRAQLAEQYEPWALENFSGYLAADELYDGPFCVLAAVDSKRQRRLACEVLEHSPTQEDVRRFLQRVADMLKSRGLVVHGVTTDGSPLYPQPLHDIWPMAAHQVCEFHVLKEITKDVLRAMAKLRKSLVKQIPALPRGRPSAKNMAMARQAKRQHEQVSELFDNRYLLVQRNLGAPQLRILRKLTRRYPEVRDLRQLMDEVYRLFDRRCRTHTALVKLAKLRRRLARFEHLGKVLSKLRSPNLDKALTFLDDKLLEATSNSVERANRRHRKMQKSVYRVRTSKSLTSRIALDFFRDKDMATTTLTVSALHLGRTPITDGFWAAYSRRSC